MGQSISMNRVEYPSSAKFWIDGEHKESDHELRKTNAKKVVAWLTNAIINAHRNPNIKRAAVQLLLVKDFTVNLGAFGCWDLLRTVLITQLTTLGAPLHDRYSKLDLGNVLSDKLVGCDKLKYHSLLPKKQQDHTAKLTHVDLLPRINNLFDFSGDQLGKLDDRTLLVVILMISQAVDAMFQKKTRTIVRTCKKAVLRGAPTKQYARALNKALSDHLDKQQPRTAYNIDTVRALLMVSNPTTMIEAFRLLVKGFDGVAKVKNLFALPKNARADRSNLLVLMVTVIFNSGMTFGEMAKDPTCQQLFDAFAADVPHAEPKERWERMCKRARDYLNDPSIANEKVRTYGEIQIILKPDAIVRHKMHLVYKIVRAETGAQLYDDFLQSYEKPSVARELEADILHVYHAAYDGRLSVVVALLDSGAHVDNTMENTDGTTPLIIACERNHPDVVQLLIDRGAAINKVKDNGTTPLYNATQRNLLDMTKMLISNDAAIDQASYDGTTPLSIASETNSLAVVRYLVSNHAAIDKADSNGVTPLYLASKESHIEVVKCLVDNNAAIDKGDVNGSTPLHMASQKNSVNVVKFLISNKAALDQVDKNGRAPLNSAASQGHLDIIRVLVAAGADLNVKGILGTPLKRAIKKENDNVAEYLRQHDALVEYTEC